ncbi:MAG: TraM recognition domain-containing protein [Pseudonocardiaceae bacterium]|nr:TraM recognition domain-containing protein [Pseudonocardiaceae bacterium]
MTTLLLLGLGITVAATVVLGRRRQHAPAAVATGLAVLLAWQLATWAPLLSAALAAALGVVGWVRLSRTASTVSRWGARSRRKAGVASTLDVARLASAAAVRRKATVVRPSLAELPAGRRLRAATTEVAVPLCRVGALRVWASIEDVCCLFGGPRTGKTGYLAGRVLDAPGATLVTSTRTDLHDLTARLRTQRGPVFVFNAVGLGDLPSTITFDPLTGCADPVTAAERATDLIAAGQRGGGDSDRAWWDAQARRVLAALLHAAALGNLSMRDVQRWVSVPSEAGRQVTSLLRRCPEPAYAEEVAQFLDTNERTQSSITTSITPALGWLASPAASAAASGATPFDVAELLRSRATVYLLGAEETQAAPLVTALTGHIAREARRIAARQPGGRLDPPLTLVLDEAALISPVPLDSWTADMGGRGVTILTAFQSRAQLIARWGQTGAAIILNNAAAVMVFGGTKDRDDLDYWSVLAGERDEPITTTDHHGRAASRSVRKVAVLTPAQLANLPAGRVVVYRRGMAPVIGRVRMAWHRRDVRAQARTDQRQARHERRQARAVIAGAEAATRHADTSTSGRPPAGATRNGHHPGPGDPGDGTPTTSPGRVPRWVESTREDRR